jgi:hypothetical protein
MHYLPWAEFLECKDRKANQESGLTLVFSEQALPAQFNDTQHRFLKNARAHFGHSGGAVHEDYGDFFILKPSFQARNFISIWKA